MCPTIPLINPLYSIKLQGVQSQRGKGATFWIELFYPLAKPSEVEAAIKQEDSFSQPTFATTATIAEEERWPAVAFADDVKLPMLRGTVAHTYSSPSLLASSPTISMNSSLPTPSLLRMGSDIPLLEIRQSSDEDSPDRLSKVPEAPSSPVSLSIPESKSSPPAPAAGGSSSSDDDDGGPLVVLVVDDNFITRTTMARCVIPKSIDFSSNPNMPALVHFKNVAARFILPKMEKNV